MEIHCSKVDHAQANAGVIIHSRAIPACSS